MKLVELLKEISTQSYDYGCAMVYFKFPELEDIHKLINKEDTYTEDEDKSFGLEDEPHCTLLYGLHKEVSKQDVESVLDNYTFHTCKLTNPSLFENEKYDVLKFEVRGDNLNEINSDLKEFPHTTSYPDYNPHLTIGYLKPGTGQKYADKIKEIYDDIWLAPQFCVYSTPSGEKHKISIKID